MNLKAQRKYVGHKLEVLSGAGQDGEASRSLRSGQNTKSSYLRPLESKQNRPVGREGRIVGW